MEGTAIDSGLQQVIYQAALLEFLDVGIDRLRLDRIAKRAGVDPSLITHVWGDHRVLFLEAAIDYALANFVMPDTGNLRDDLLAVAVTLAEVPHKGWFRRMLAVGGDADLSEVRTDYWAVRANDLAPVFQRAADRGELREAIDPVDAIRMFTTACLCDVLFTGGYMRPGYVTQLVDIFVHGVTRPEHA